MEMEICTLNGVVKIPPRDKNKGDLDDAPYLEINIF